MSNPLPGLTNGNKTTVSPVIGLGHYAHYQDQRPRWFPDECPGCEGFGYVRSGKEWTACDHCLDHPGHVCTFQQHAAARSDL